MRYFTRIQLPKGLDGPAYVFYLRDVASAARKELGVGPGVWVEVLHDGCSWHSSDNGPKEELRKLKLLQVRLGEKFPPRSMDLNPIENLFGICAKELDDKNAKKRAASVTETKTRFGGACEKAAEQGLITNMAKSMPERCRDVIEAEGGLTRWQFCVFPVKSNI